MGVPLAEGAWGTAEAGRGGTLTWYLVHLTSEMPQRRPRGCLSTGNPGAGVTPWVVFDRWGPREPGLLWSSESEGRGGESPGAEGDRKTGTS